MEKSDTLLIKLRGDIQRLRLRVERLQRELVTLQASLNEHEAAERVLSSMLGVSNQYGGDDKTSESPAQRFVGLKDIIVRLVTESRTRGMSPEELSDAITNETSVLPSQGSLYGTLSRLKKLGAIRSDGSRWYATETSLPFRGNGDPSDAVF